MLDPEVKALLDQILEQLQQNGKRQKLTANAVADLAIGLNSAQRQALDRHQELLGIMLGAQAAEKVERARKDSGDYTDKFKLPTGDRIELTKRTQKRILRWVLVGLLAVATNAAQFLWHELAHRERSTPQAAPASER